MSIHPAIKEMLKRYDLNTTGDCKNALKEIYRYEGDFIFSEPEDSIPF